MHGERGGWEHRMERCDAPGCPAPAACARAASRAREGGRPVVRRKRAAPPPSGGTESGVLRVGPFSAQTLRCAPLCDHRTAPAQPSSAPGKRRPHPRAAATAPAQQPPQRRPQSLCSPASPVAQRKAPTRTTPRAKQPAAGVRSTRVRSADERTRGEHTPRRNARCQPATPGAPGESSNANRSAGTWRTRGR